MTTLCRRKLTRNWLLFIKIFMFLRIFMVGNGFALVGIPSTKCNEQILSLLFGVQFVLFWFSRLRAWIHASLSLSLSLFAFCHFSWKTVKIVKFFTVWKLSFNYVFVAMLYTRLFFPLIYSVSSTVTFNNSTIYFWHVLWYQVKQQFSSRILILIKTFFFLITKSGSCY